MHPRTPKNYGPDWLEAECSQSCSQRLCQCLSPPQTALSSGVTNTPVPAGAPLPWLNFTDPHSNGFYDLIMGIGWENSLPWELLRAHTVVRTRQPNVLVLSLVLLHPFWLEPQSVQDTECMEMYTMMLRLFNWIPISFLYNSWHLYACLPAVSKALCCQEQLIVSLRSCSFCGCS